ncbi:hypothetical protein AB0M45_17880 [Nocardia sp. NPDC051787]|uniref:hypothetical protein n=1 Tax=Nocardia sp. NPDC051787 TaxID=3155415 RepID=UPI0034372E5D
MNSVLPEVFPWVAFLSREEVQEFVLELVTALRAGESLGDPVPVAEVIESWRHTAEALADRALASTLESSTDQDFGAVPAPPDFA